MALEARQAPTIKRWSLDARSGDNPDHLLGAVEGRCGSVDTRREESTGPHLFHQGVWFAVQKETCYSARRRKWSWAWRRIIFW